MVWTKHITAAGKASKNGNYEEAQRQLQSALVEAERLSPLDRRLARTLNDLAEVSMQQEKEELAQSYWLRVIELGDKHLIADDPEVIRGLDGILFLYYKRKQDAKLEPFVNLAMKAYEQGSKYQAPSLANILFMLASLLQMQAKNTEAERLARLALELRQNLLGEDHIDLMHELELLISLTCAQGKYAEAEILYNRLLKLVEKELGKDDLLISTIHQNMASMYLGQGKYLKAEQCYANALQIIEQYAQAENYLMPLLGRYATFLRGINRIEEAEVLESHKTKLKIRQDEL